jgi:hypothetical protein
MPKGKADEIELIPLSFDETSRKAWKPKPPPKDGKSSVDQLRMRRIRLRY